MKRKPAAILFMSVVVLAGAATVGILVRRHLAAPSREELNSPAWWLSEAFEAASAVNDREVRGDLYVWILQQQADARDQSGAARTLAALREGRSAEADFETLLRVSEHYARAGWWDAAEALLREAQTLSRSIAGEDALARSRGLDMAYQQVVSEQIEGKALALPVRPTVLVIESLDPLTTAARWIGELQASAAGTSLFGDPEEVGGPGNVGARVTWDGIRIGDPDALILALCGHDLASAREAAEALMDKRGRVGGVKYRVAAVADPKLFHR
ncbi:MAG: hypothetical protein KY476_20945, partial [Planctomycetes bacterium]|nr:hypothetical protein [Planctomycetota bacterium]